MENDERRRESGMSEDKVTFGGAAEDINTNSFSSPGTPKKKNPKKLNLSRGV